MPIHLTSRRQFLTQLWATSVLLQVNAFAADVDENLIAILNDTHIGAQHPASKYIPKNLRKTVA
jgi:hypothetical protein